MKIFTVLLFVALFEVYGQTTKDTRMGRQQSGNYSQTQVKDDVIRGQSATDRKTYMPGSLKERQDSESIKGTRCMDGNGKAYYPTDKFYTKCVDQANRIK